MVSLDLLINESDQGIQTESVSPRTAATGEEAVLLRLEQATPEAEPAKSDSKPKGPATCGVCEAAASKYKCSRCYLP